MPFEYRDGALCAEAVALEEIAGRYGTPCYVYSRAAIERRFGEFQQALAGRRSLIAYSVKANSNLAILSLLARAGAGFDIVSGGELERVRAAGGDPGRVLFSGVGKTEEEIELALRSGLMCLNLESEAELARVDSIAGRLGMRAPIAFRVNPDVDARSHPYISTGLKHNKFGVAYAQAERLYQSAARCANVRIEGIGCHIGSQLVSAAPYVDAAARLLALAQRLNDSGIGISHLDLGGGFGIRYKDEQPAPVSQFMDGALGVLAGRRELLIVDPGRAIVGEAGLLLARVEYVKKGEAKNFVVVDAAMNDLLRPSLYDAWHQVRPVRQSDWQAGAEVYDVVGPICESGDFLARDRALHVREGSLLAFMCAGAYGMAMSSNYNTRPRAAEVLVDGARAHLVRRRETVAELLGAEAIPAWQ